MVDVYNSSRRVDVGEVEIEVSEHGPPDGAPVLLIHGWPDTANLWRNQIPALADAGYRVLAPDLRGYGRSDKPRDVEAYQLSRVAPDLVALLDDAGVDTCHVVGHDFGSAIGWYFALTVPERLETLCALSVGHPLAFQNAGFGQLRRSWYMLLFQFPGVAEQWLSDHDWANFRAFSGGHPETQAWIDNLSGPNALTSSLGLYRANMGPERLVRPHRELPPIDLPVMGIWSAGDFALVEHQMTGSADYVTAEFRYERIEEASHWIPLDAPDELNGLLLDWLGRH